MHPTALLLTSTLLATSRLNTVLANPVGRLYISDTIQPYAVHFARQEPPTSQTTDPSPSTSSSASPSPSGPRNHNVAVAQNGTQFTPTALKNIPPGDTLTFYFYPHNYSIVQSSYDEPCKPLLSSDTTDANDHQQQQAALFSGFQPSPDSSSIARQKFVMTVESTEPMWIYGVDGTGYFDACGEGGMVVVVNPAPKREGVVSETMGGYRKKADKAGVNGVGESVPRDMSVRGGEVRAMKEREAARWLGKHPLGGNVKNETGEGGRSGNATEEVDEVATYTSEAG